MNRLKTLLLAATCSVSLALNAQDNKPALQWKDISKWNYNRGHLMSADGQWISWAAGPTEGDLSLKIRKTFDTLQYSYPIGATANMPVFSRDSRFLAFKVSAKDSDAKAARKTNKPLYDQLTLLDLSKNDKTIFERVKGFGFSGEAADWLAVQFMPLETAPKDKDAAKGTDVLLFHTTTKKRVLLGSVTEYVFNKAGNVLAYLVDAHGQNGNGLYIRDMKTGLTFSLDNDKAVYKSLTWNDEGTGFAVLKANKNELYKDEVYTVIGIQKINGDLTSKISYNGVEDVAFPKGMGISGNANPYWSEDGQVLFFGINTLQKKEEKAANKTDSTAKNKPEPPKVDIEKPDMIIWNWQDRRLQSAQQTQEMRDKNFSFLSSFQLPAKQFRQLADSNARNVVIGPKSLYALAYDNSRYELSGNLDGQSYSDVYLIDLKTGQRKLLFEKLYANNGGRLVFAPNGKQVSYYMDGVYYSMQLDNGQVSNLTGQINSSFVNEMSDHNVDKPATQNFGWTADSKFVLIKDNYDLWKISADGKSFSALTDQWKSQRTGPAFRMRIYPDEKGIDLSKDQYFMIFNSKNKKSGLGLLAAGKNRIQVLSLEDETFGSFTKAEKGKSFIFTKSDYARSPVVYVSETPDLKNARKINENTPDQQKYAWSSGVRLVEYVSSHGDTLQGALYLPANYVEGKAYPTITYIYERLSDEINTYTMPGFPGGGFNKSIYTSNGYAVFMPDIKYRLNDPGMSAVACVVPAVKAAIATGIVDAKNVAIHGHSWGGYQTSFLITQTNLFKAAAAGAPLTNMISMYSLIYWNSGGTNQAIFESSQGRLTPGYWDNWEAFVRNSPIYHIKNVETPLLLLHNDKDGAVDYTQGIEYYNGLRRLGKPVVMITYKGENHGIVKLPNRKDYAVRMMEYFDYMLKGADAPDWWSKGVDRLGMEKHLEQRAFEE